MREKILLDPHFRPLLPMFPPEQLERLRALAEVLWARDEPMPAEEIARVRGEVSVIVCGGWRHGEVGDFPKLRAVIDVGGAFPPVSSFDYETAFARGIRVLACAPGFAPAVAEMALGLALASVRRIAATDAAFRRGTEQWGTRGRITPTA